MRLETNILKMHMCTTTKKHWHWHYTVISIEYFRSTWDPLLSTRSRSLSRGWWVISPLIHIWQKMAIFVAQNETRFGYSLSSECWFLKMKRFKPRQPFTSLVYQVKHSIQKYYKSTYFLQKNQMIKNILKPHICIFLKVGTPLGCILSLFVTSHIFPLISNVLAL